MVPIPPAPDALAVDAEIDAWCQQLGLRQTGPRRSLLRLVLARSDHFTADDLCIEARQRALRVSRATVYRTLPALCEAGILRATDFGDGLQLYARARPNGQPTAEIYVVDCGRVVDVPAPFLSWYAQAVTTKAGFELISQRLQTFARCPHKRADCSCKQCPAR